ncbi:MAG TPA: hypothetical protein VKB52_04360 [Rhodanobacteraceae bacterium]|nr:hypothetical protein [Rhodanobacteraceae bacterium]
MISWPLPAATLYLSGSVGTAPVFVTVERSGETIDGWYLYLKQGRQIRLVGKVDAKGALTLTEKDASTDKATGTFEGAIAGERWSGTWQKPGGTATIPFSITENHDALADASGHFRCTAKKTDSEFHYTYRHSLDLTLRHGEVGALSLDRTATSTDGDEQACHLGKDDLERAASTSGLLLTTGDEKPHCTVRVLRAGDYLYVATGDANEDGNDCRMLEDTAFCSPRAFWTDLIVNTKTNACRSVE